MAGKQVRVESSGSSQTGHVSVSLFPVEQFVDAKTVSAFLAIPRADVLRMTREGKFRGYAYRGRLRHVNLTSSRSGIHIFWLVRFYQFLTAHVSEVCFYRLVIVVS